MIGPEALKAIDEGARYSALIAPIVHALICDDQAELHRLLDSVDPIDATLTANKLRVVLDFHAQDRGGTSASPTDAAGPNGPSVLPDAHERLPHERDDGPAEQATAPSSPQVVHAFDNWSRKVPCG